MFVIMKESSAIACFDNQVDAVAYWNEHGGTIILYPDLKSSDVFINSKED